MLFAIDLEGVLAPEIWPVLGAHFELPELQLTTRDVGDFEDLMHRRVAALRARGITLRQLEMVAHGVHPYLGAREFLGRLRDMGQVLIISDTFHEFSEPLVQELGGHSLFANHFELDGNGTIAGFKLRIRGQKERIVSGLKSAGFVVAAMGDSLNDLSLLKSSDHRVLYRPVPALLQEFPDAPLASNLDEALAFMQAAVRAETLRGGA
jgi:phosphoserine / homoserine phosphotransferase